MNHFQLFLNASTQMIFIVYASLSVLRVFHVSTFVEGWQEQPGQSGRQVHLALPSSHKGKVLLYSW